MKDQQDADAEITLIGSSTFDQEIEEAESDVDSMPGDEILSISREDNDEDESEKELSVVDEVVADNIIDELITEANKRDTNVSAASTNEVLSEFVPQSTFTSSLADVQALIAKALEIQITKALGSDPFSHLTRRVDFLAAQVHNLTKTFPDQFDDKMNSATRSVSRIIFDALAQQFPDLLSATIKNSLPQALTKAVRETLPGFNRRIKNSINDEMIEVLKTSVLKPMYKEFNALNKLETHRFIILKNMLRKSIHKTFGKSVKKNIHSHIGEEKKNIPRVKILNIHTLGAIRRFREIQITKALGSDPFSHLTRRVDFLATQVHNLTKTFPDQFDDKMNSATRSVSRIIFDALAQQRIKNSINDEMIEVLKTSVLKPMYKEFNALNKLETHSGKRKVIEEEAHDTTPTQLRAQEEELAEIETKRIQHMNKMRDEYHYINFRDDALPITKFIYKWVATTTNKLGLPLPPQLTIFELPPAEKKRKRRVEVMKEVFLKEYIIVDGMHKKLTPSEGVINHWYGIRNKIRDFVYNGSLDLVFQRESEFHLATTSQLIRIQIAIKVDSVIAIEMYDKMIYVIEAKSGFVEAREVNKGSATRKIYAFGISLSCSYPDDEEVASDGGCCSKKKTWSIA
ncbi:hypothetical protein Tco_0600284 [Tanacetum coccineum]|uniref:Uncharacterized protein n=1 Tax=Tanacetum coccineum TaxID=301880 RepID=A0ABQ4WBA9_9ASTR